jgi:hypothetical protein
MKTEISLRELVGLMSTQSNSLCYAFSMESMAFVESSTLETSPDQIPSNEDLTSLHILSSSDMISIPSKTEINEFAIMKQFAHHLYNPDITKEILSVMHGSGVFKRFNEIVMRRGIHDEWLKFRMQSFKNHAISWCKKNSFTYKDDTN